MAKRSKRKKVIHCDDSKRIIEPKDFFHKSRFQPLFMDCSIPLLLATMAFLIYEPSLKSDFVYDAREEILKEGFITSLSNLPAVLSLKVLNTNLMLGDRPGQMLYMMLIATIWGKEPFGYHLCSNLLHAMNVALLFMLLRRLIETEVTSPNGKNILKIQLAAVAVTLIFALHPIAVESVSEVSYSSSLLVVFFALIALLLATLFRPENFRLAMITGSLGAFSAFASVASKESGIATALLLIVYWFLFRRREAKGPWLLFLGAAITAAMAFLAARFLFAPPAMPGPAPLNYLGGSIFQVFLIQPRLWIFMMGELLWPVHLSADYTLVDMNTPSTPLAIVILIVVVLLQAWLAFKSPLGALGIAFYWLGLVTVSNFTPLYHPLADRFYYLPLAGVSIQLMALLLMTSRYGQGFWMTLVPCLGAILPLTYLTLAREDVFANEFSLWSNTLQVSPLSASAENGLGHVLFEKGQVDEAMPHFQKALDINPNYVTAHYDLGLVFLKKGQEDAAIAQLQKAMEINPHHIAAHYNLGVILLQKGQVDEAMTQFRKALAIDPSYVGVHYNLGLAFSRKGQSDEAMTEFQEELKIDPGFAEAHANLGVALLQKGQLDEAIFQFKKVLEINPNFAEAHNNLGIALFQKGRLDEAMAQFQEAVQLKPDYSDAQYNLNKAKDIMVQRENQK